MGVIETFSKRKKRLEKAGKQDVYQYDALPMPFRVQVIHIWDSAFGVYYVPATYDYRPASAANRWWTFVHDTVAREHGVFALSDSHSTPDLRCKEYLIGADTGGALDLIELSFRVIDRGIRGLHTSEKQTARVTQDADDAIEELNNRFLEHGLGYQYVDGCIVPMDSQFVHAEAVKPALSLLGEAGFDGAADEFIRGFDHYRHGRIKEAISEALKSLESTMKAICSDRNWPFPPNATAKPLMDIMFKNGIVPPDLESHFSGLRSAMESGLPTLSNKTSRHGQGAVSTTVPPHFAAYALHLAATNIVFLVQAHRAMK
jgi:hypothetical protein